MALSYMRGENGAGAVSEKHAKTIAISAGEDNSIDTNMDRVGVDARKCV